MDNLASNKYRMKRSTPQILSSLGYRRYIGANSELYFYRFPVYKYKKATVIECEIITENNTGKTTINVYEKNTMSKYPPFYSVEVQNQYSPIFLNTMDIRISNELKKLDIVKQKERK